MGRVNKSAVIVLFTVLFTGICYGQKDIKQTLESFTHFSQFLRILRKAQLDEAFSGSRTRMTLFAFNNSAYDQLSVARRQKLDRYSQAEAQRFIQAHTVYNKDFRTTDMNGANLKEMSMNGLPLYVSKRTESSFNFEGTFGATLFFVNGAQINNYFKDMQCRNGYLHSLMDVMHVPVDGTAFSYLTKIDKGGRNVPTGVFKNLLDKLSFDYFAPVSYMKNLQHTLTLFVPSDEAMNKIPKAKLRQLEGDEVQLQKIVYAHYIAGSAVFTESAIHNHGFQDGQPSSESNNRENRIIIRKPNLDNVYVNSMGVNAEIVYGNLTCLNGVVHIIDKLLGFVYFTVREEITRGSSQFDQLINRAAPEVIKSLTDQSRVTVFVPTNEAFQNIANLPWININLMNQTLANMILRLHLVYQGRTVDISALTGAYESRQIIESQDYGAMLSVYNERNESWVQGGPRGQGGVKAKVLEPDVACKNGKVNYIDSVLGVPYLDIPMLICDDLWLLKTYDYLRTLEMTNYLKDRRFEAKKCYFENYGYPPNWGNNNQYATVTPYPQFWNPAGTTTQRIVKNLAAHNMGYCGQNRVGCTFTFFVPNSTAIDKFQARQEGQMIMRDYPRFQFLFRRLMIPNKMIILSEMADGTSRQEIAHNGDYLSIRKSGQRNFEISYKQSTATIIHSDQAATNGVIHIISDLLYDRSDLTRDVSRSSYISWNTYLILLGLLLSVVLFRR